MIENLPTEYIRTDFGHEVYDEWYLQHGNYNFEAPDFVKRHIPFYQQALGLSHKDYILDAGCGIGSYTREFARCGFPVIGMDLSSNFLSVARQNTLHENLEIEYILGDYNEMSFQDEFSVIFFEGSFFYKSREGLVSLLSGIYKALKSDGRLYFVHPNQTIIKKKYPWTKQTEIQKNVFIHQNAEYDEENEGETHTWLKIDYNTNRHFKCDFFVKLLSPKQLKVCLDEAGFRVIHFYKKRRLEDFQPNYDNGFSLVAFKN
ncbi:hypothetical protein C6497_08780 [Candidatus Poribacteria bacterium]|nr:MAG: hypothetical protein C6497_08780 [Candidatus Poribacteria bacterium]